MNRRAYILGVVGVFVAMAAATALRAFAEAAFLSSYGAKWLPYLLVAQAGAFAAGTTLYDVAAARASLPRADAALGVTLAIAAGLAPALVEQGGKWPFVVALGVVAISSVVNLAVWNAVAASVAGRDARRWLPRAGAAATAGGAAAGLGAAAIVRGGGADIVPWIAAVLGLVVVMVGVMQRAELAKGGAPGATAPPGTSATAMSGDHRRLLRWLAAAALLEAAVATVLEFRFGAGVKARWHGADLVMAISLFLGCTNAFLLLLQLTVVPRLLVTQNLPFTASTHPVLIGLGLGGLVAAPGFPLLASVRTGETVLRAATSRTAQEIALSALPPVPRARWKVLLRGAATPLGAALGGGALVLLGKAALTEPRLVFGGALFVAVLWLIAVRIAARAFLAALAAPLGMKGLTQAAGRETLDLDALHRLVDAAGSDDARTAALARAALARGGGRADEIVGHLDHDDPRVRATLYELAARRPSPAARAELRAAAAIEDDGATLAAAVKALAAHGDAEGVAAARERGDLEPEVARAARGATAQLVRGDPADARRAFGEVLRIDGDWAANLARTRADALDALAIDAAIVGALGGGAAVRREAFRAAAAAGGPASVRELLAALAGGDESAFAAVADLDRLDAQHLAASLPAVSPTADQRAALARSLSAAPDAAIVLEQLATDPDDDVRGAALRSLAGAARAGHAPTAAFAASVVERERDTFEALLAVRAPAGVRSDLHAAELARATRRSLRRVLDAVALETAAAGRDPGPLAAAGRRLDARAEPTRRRALDVLQEIAKARPRILDAVERWLRPPGATPDAASRLAPHDGWLTDLLGGALAELEPRLAALRACAFFDELPGRHAAALATGAREVTLAGGDAAVTAGEVGDAMYVVLSGELVVETGGESPPRLRPGAVVGEIALIDAAPRAATVRATEPTRLLAIDRAAFQAALTRWPDLGMGLLKTLAARLR